MHSSKVTMLASSWRLLAMAACLISTSLFAQSERRFPDIDTPGLTIEVQAGWDGFADRSAPLAISLLIRNDSPQTVEGVLTIHDPSGGRSASLGEVVIAPGTSRKVTSIQTLSDWMECFVTLSHQRDLLWRRELDLNSGKWFSPNVNYAIFVEGTGRKLDLPGAPGESATVDYQQLQVAATTGRPLQTLTAKPWQLPHHPGPLSVIQAIVIPDGVAERDINQVQWRSIAEWMCQGGIVFVPRSASEITDRLARSSPLAGGISSEKSPLAVRQFGVGAMYEYDGSPASAGDSELKLAIAREIANCPKDQLHAALDHAYYYRYYHRRARQADTNRYLMMGLFAGYTLLMGGGGLFLFRLNKRQVGTYTVVVVATASLLAATLGGYLRFSKGDLDWVTVTQPGTGGLIQYAGLQVQSAGGRSSKVAVRGENADLQAGDIVRYNYYNALRQIGYPPFTWQPNLEREASDIYQIPLAMSPWGRRRCHATAYRSEPGQLEVGLKFEPANSAQQAADTLPAGNFRLMLTNGLPFDLKNCWLIVGATANCPPNSNLMTQLQSRGYRYGMNRQGNLTVDDQIDVYHMERLQDFVSGTTLEREFPANFTLTQPYEMGQLWQMGCQLPLRLQRMGSTRAWVIGQISKSPILSIEESRSDFIADDGTHLFVQEIAPESLPAAWR